MTTGLTQLTHAAQLLYHAQSAGTPIAPLTMPTKSIGSAEPAGCMRLTFNASVNYS